MLSLLCPECYRSFIAADRWVMNWCAGLPPRGEWRRHYRRSGVRGWAGTCAKSGGSRPLTESCPCLGLYCYLLTRPSLRVAWTCGIGLASTPADARDGAAGEGRKAAAPRSGKATSVVDVFLVCAALGGGEAKKMACLPQHRHMKLIPWGGVSRLVLLVSVGALLTGFAEWVAAACDGS